MLKRLSGYSDMNVGLLGVLPYIAGFLLMQANGWHSDKMRERRWHASIPTFLAAAALLGLATQPRSMALSLVLFTIVGMGIAYLPVFWAVPTEILSQSAAAAAIGMINAVGSVAGFAGPYFFGYLNTQTGSFSFGLGVTAAAAFAGGLLILGAPKSARAPAAAH
jgi:nitrate/nitrite transporter NarK